MLLHDSNPLIQSVPIFLCGLLSWQYIIFLGGIQTFFMPSLHFITGQFSSSHSDTAGRLKMLILYLSQKVNHQMCFSTADLHN